MKKKKNTYKKKPWEILAHVVTILQRPAKKLEYFCTILHHIHGTMYTQTCVKYSNHSGYILCEDVTLRAVVPGEREDEEPLQATVWISIEHARVMECPLSLTIV